MPKLKKYSIVGFIQCDVVEQTTNLKGLSFVQLVAGMIHSVDGEVKEGTSRAQVEVERDKTTLDEPISVSVQMVVHHKACAEIRTTHQNCTRPPDYYLL